MSDQWIPTSRGGHLRGRVNKDTLPEVTLRRAVHAQGLRFRLHRRIAKGCTADFVLPRFQVAVFVDGDFWHGCPAHGRVTGFAGPNAQLWEAKIRRNRERDFSATRLAEARGWRTLRIWECEVMADSVAVAERVAQFAHSVPAGGSAPR